MRSLPVIAVAGAKIASAFTISDYILAAGWTPAYAPSFQTPHSSAAIENSVNTAEPCGLVSQQLANSNSPFVDADLAYECLRSVPLDKDGGVLQLSGILNAVQFQTTLAYLENPPSGYPYPAVDIVGSLELLLVALQDNTYSNEYDFQLAIYNIISSAYDGHFNYPSDIVQVFTFARGYTLFSLSVDGISSPEVYLTGSTAHPTEYLTSNETLVAIAQINGEDAETWLNAYATLNGGNQDQDANYNALFPTIPTLPSEGQTGSFTASSFYQGPVTNITYQDGTTAQIKNQAVTLANFTGVTDGESFFAAFCTGAAQAQLISEESSALKPRSLSSSHAQSGKRQSSSETPFEPAKSAPTFAAAPYYPKPIVAQQDYSVAGYFPKTVPELAVLSIPSFEPADTVGFSNTVRTFLATAQSAGKTNLIIDLRGNGGGDVLLAYDTFVQLFPQLYPYGGTNFRATPMVNDLGAIVSGAYSNITIDDAPAQDCNNDFDIPLVDYQITVDAAGAPFTSWDDFFGPHEHHGDNFTSIDRIDLDNAFSTLCQPISNYQNLSDITPQVFDPANVVILQDGACASTCAVFTEFMKTQASVPQIAFGGRQATGPMQGVGGVKGANVYSYDTLASVIDSAVNQLATPEQAKAFNATYGDIVGSINHAISRATSNSEGSEARVNVRNNIRPGDDTVTPLQFVYEAADCRLYYTPEMIVDQEQVWLAASAANWFNAPCVPGSTGQPSADPDYLGLDGPDSSDNNNTSPSYPTSASVSFYGTAGGYYGTAGGYYGTAVSGLYPRGTLAASNQTGVWSSTWSGAATATTTTWGAVRAPTTTSALTTATTTTTASTGLPSGVIAAQGAAVANRVSGVTVAITLLGSVAGMMLFL